MDGQPDPLYAGGFVTCQACLALEQAQHEQAKKDEAAAKSGNFVAHVARLWQAVKVPPQQQRRR